MLKAFLISFSFWICFSNCNDHSAKHTEIDSLFDSLNSSQLKRYIDSLSGAIDRSIPVGEKGFRIPEKGTVHYYEERPFVNRKGELWKYTLYEFSTDTFQSRRDYYFYLKKLIKVDIWNSKFGKVESAGKYYFRNGIFIDSSNYNLKIPPHMLRSQASDYLKKYNRRS